VIAPCPVCGGFRTEATLIGGLRTIDGYDDSNHAKCLSKSCGHRGKVGDWQRIAEGRRMLAVVRAEMQTLQEKFTALRDELTTLLQPPTTETP
jgi:hypothetical protein